MSDDAGVLRVAFRLAAGCVAAEGITKAAGAGYSRDLAMWADGLMPVAEVVCAVERRLDSVDDWIRAAEDQALAEKSLAMSIRGAEEPHQMIPLDPEQMRLRATLGPHPGPAYVNGHSNGHEYEEASDGQ